MNQGGKGKSKNIVDVLATIQKIVDEEDPGVNSKSGSSTARLRLDELSSRNYALLEDLPSCVRSKRSTALVAQAKGDLVKTPVGEVDLPRAMGRITDTRITELSRVGRDVKTNDRHRKGSHRAIADRYFSAMLPRWPASLTSCSSSSEDNPCLAAETGNSNDLPMVPVNYRQNALPIPEPKSPGGLPGLPALAMPNRAELSRAPADGPTAMLDNFTAELLRPLIVDWVNENMPRILEQALSLENSASET